MQMTSLVASEYSENENIYYLEGLVMHFLEL